jgi:hypothetical protein
VGRYKRDDVSLVYGNIFQRNRGITSSDPRQYPRYL